jgi:hypothetical protein
MNHHLHVIEIKMLVSLTKHVCHPNLKHLNNLLLKGY